REALVLAVLRQHLRRHREKRIRELLAHDLGDTRLVLRIHEGKEEAHRDRLDARLLQLAHLLARALLIERHEHAAVARDPFGNGEPVAAAHDRVPLPGEILVVREVERLLVPRDVEDVTVALSRDQADLRAVVPWKTWSSAAGVSPACPASSSIPRTVPSDGSSGVVGIL